MTDAIASFSPPSTLTTVFVALTLAVVAVDVFVVAKAAPPARRQAWAIRAAVAAAVWLALHAIIAESGILAKETVPPPAFVYLSFVVAVGVAVVWSPLGRRMAGLPLALLVAVQAFRLPLEAFLHALYEAGALPVQMTWSGRNLDVITGAAAILVAFVMHRGAHRAVVWVWNVIGFALLINVVTIALLSAPLPIRQFHNDPAVVLIFHAPYNWIVNVHVWTALVGHLIVFRALLTRHREDAP